ncbi:MAG: hypothetical protein DSZ31_02645 [Gammaproteobacteria bacterium]|nr:MAG: hypothetical protein DSZ31_02645 [Gammaproteobacteria bacterium]RTZ69625.1 MAG: hypothetical protein DSZ30_02170 [Aquificaceae bacterium]
MFEILRVQAVAQGRPQVERAETKTTQANIKLSHIPKDLSSFLDFVPLGFQLEAFVKKATREEVVLRLFFLGREVEITVKNLLGIQFKPNQKVFLTLIDRNPYVFKLSLSLADGYKIFSRIREFFKSPLPAVLRAFLNFSDLPTEIKNSGLFYEYKVVRYLLGKEDAESLRSDIKYKLLSLINTMGFNRPKHQIFVRPLGKFVKSYTSLPLWRVNLTNFLNAYMSFYELSPTAVENLARFIYLSRGELKRKYPFLFKKTTKRRKELDKPLFFAPLKREAYQKLISSSVGYNLLKETVEFLQFLQGWSIVQNYGKAIIPFTHRGKKFFLGIYPAGGKKNISLLWEKGLVKLSYMESNPWQGELLFVLKDEKTLERFKRDIETLKRELQEVYFRVLNVKFATAGNTEELFILDMADKEHSNFVKLYL